jgi:addiction module HigA family antidote
MTIKNGMRPIHPGEILREEFAKPLELSANEMARCLNVPTNRVTGILNEERAVTADTALRLAAYLGTTPGFWLGLQQDYELRTAEIESAKIIASTVKPLSKAGAAKTKVASKKRRVA